MDTKTIELSIEDALALTNNVLPVLEAIPAIAPEAGLASLAVSGAQVLTPLIFKLVNTLAEKGEISADVQADQLTRLQKVLDFSGSEWKPSVVPEPPKA